MVMKDTALVIIDMQKGIFATKTVKFDSDGVISRINFLSKKCRSSHCPVIFIQQDSSLWNRFIPNTTEWEILSELDVEEDDIAINKKTNDAFYQSELNVVLNDLNIMNLIIVGFATEFCVNATVQSALGADFNVTVIKDGHTTTDKEHMDAQTMIKHYNWVWQNLIPTKGKVEVIDFEEAVKRMEH